ncbi:hypothetical protein N7520_008836 [Penicillium odoratum]|uniref:uncharacterized protein n=1 Tax=Penicillium odoratum TaxID=1167516 RepID=UPI002547B878|nr:uncharacterized protein N7520_008836 [Penicillium odoratum]KAJ5751919.1 hypothetical protein N7520_008836 [Penicillium odoratum]
MAEHTVPIHLRNRRRGLRVRPMPQTVILDKKLPQLVPSLEAISQTSCPLFSLLPAEIRNHIYALALESDDYSTNENSDALYPRNTFYYRPGYKQPKRMQTALLQTCQQIYDEASLLPIAINEHTFWFYRAPPHVNDASLPHKYFRRMTLKQRYQVQHIHFFVQQYFLEDHPGWSRAWAGIDLNESGPVAPGKCRVLPKKITFTFRHTDWWYWENDDPLGMNPFRCGRTRAHEMDGPVGPRSEFAWGNQFSLIQSLEEVVIEFETIMRKREQLDGIVERALGWKFPMKVEESVYLVADPNSRSSYSWIGAKEGDLKENRLSPPQVIGGDSEPESSTTQELKHTHVVPTLKPFDLQSALKTGDGTGPSQLRFDPKTEEEFYVVFLTWRKHKVD